MQFDVLHSICRLVVINEAEQTVQYIEIETISHVHGTMSILSQNFLLFTVHERPVSPAPCSSDHGCSNVTSQISFRTTTVKTRDDRLLHLIIFTFIFKKNK